MANTGADSMMVGEEVLTTVGAVMPTMVGDAASMSMAGDAMSMLMSMADDVMSMSMADDAESVAIVDDEPSTLVDAGRSVVVGEGASESVDPDPVVPTVGAN
jgi:hypothetical protein